MEEKVFEHICKIGQMNMNQNNNERGKHRISAGKRVDSWIERWESVKTYQW